MSDVDLFVRGSGTPAAPRRRWLGPVLAVAVLALIGVLALQPVDSTTAYDPASTGGQGLRALVDTLRELGVDVVVTDDLGEAGRADTVLLPPVGWPDGTAQELARRGPRVVAQVPPDDESAQNPLGLGGIGLVDLEVDCDLLAGVTTLRTAQWAGWQPDVGTDVTERCIARGSTAWLHVVPLGDGELVSLSTMAPLVNARFLDSDAALAGVRLLAPTGAERVVVLGAPPGTPPPTLLDLVDARWFDAAWLTLLVLALLALARGRRLGRPVDEELPVRVPSGELARAIGDLRQRAGHDGRSAAELRAHTLTTCRRRLGLPPSADGEAVVAALRSQGRAVPAAVAAAAHGPLPTDGDGLVAFARALAELRALLAARREDVPAPATLPDVTTPTTPTDGRQTS